MNAVQEHVLAAVRFFALSEKPLTDRLGAARSSLVAAVNAGAPPAVKRLVAAIDRAEDSPSAIAVALLNLLDGVLTDPDNRRLVLVPRVGQHDKVYRMEPLDGARSRQPVKSRPTNNVAVVVAKTRSR